MRLLNYINNLLNCSLTNFKPLGRTSLTTKKSDVCDVVHIVGLTPNLY